MSDPLRVRQIFRVMRLYTKSMQRHEWHEFHLLTLALLASKIFMCPMSRNQIGVDISCYSHDYTQTIRQQNSHEQRNTKIAFCVTVRLHRPVSHLACLVRTFWLYLFGLNQSNVWEVPPSTVRTNVPKSSPTKRGDFFVDPPEPWSGSFAVLFR